MGMPKISTADEIDIIKCLRRWPSNRKLTWEFLRSALAEERNISASKIWSRQSLSSSESIHIAFSTAKKRICIETKSSGGRNKSQAEYEAKISQLGSEIAELQEKYDALVLRHSRLIYNASLLEGGSRLLDDPLPDNTRSQTG